MIKNTFPNKLRNSESLKKKKKKKKKNVGSWKTLQPMCTWLAQICWGRSPNCFIYNFMFLVIS